MASVKLLVLLIVLCAVIECSGRPRKKSKGSAVQVTEGGSDVNIANGGAGSATAHGNKTVKSSKKSKKVKKVKKPKKVKSSKKPKKVKKVKKPKKAKKPKKPKKSKKSPKKPKKSPKKTKKSEKKTKKTKKSKKPKKTASTEAPAQQESHISDTEDPGHVTEANDAHSQTTKAPVEEEETDLNESLQRSLDDPVNALITASTEAPAQQESHISDTEDPGHVTEANDAHSQTTKAPVEEEEEDPCVKAHNIVRRYHKDTPDVTYSSSLAADAQAWADHLAENELFAHNENLQELAQGENLYMSFGGSPTYASAVYGWYEESWHPIDGSTGRKAKHPKDYDYSYNYSDGMSFFNSGIGHFTQVVWKDTTEVGCGIASKVDSKGWLRTYIVSRYAPPGNYLGDFTDNVMKPKDQGQIELLKTEKESLLA